MPFRRSSRRGRSRKSGRRTFWTHGLWQADAIVSSTDLPGDDYNWYSFWFRWPSGFEDINTGSTTPQGSDETLVRVVSSLSSSYEGLASFVPPLDLVFGLIAFDGGSKPEFYDLATFGSVGSFVAPPHPVVDASDDWIIRIPFNFMTDGAFGSVTSESFIQSRAQRKLPPGTGILGVVGPSNLVGDPTTPTNSWSWDVRMAIRSGYTKGE